MGGIYIYPLGIFPFFELLLLVHTTKKVLRIVFDCKINIIEQQKKYPKIIHCQPHNVSYLICVMMEPKNAIYIIKGVASQTVRAQPIGSAVILNFTSIKASNGSITEGYLPFSYLKVKQ